MASCNCLAICGVLLTLLSIGYFLQGLAIAGLGVIAMVVPTMLAFIGQIDEDLDTISIILLLVAGGLLSVAAIFGCVIGCKKAFGAIITFILLIVLSIALQIASVVMLRGAVQKGIDAVTAHPVEDFQKPMNTYWTTLSTNKRNSIDRIQKLYKCCGYDGYQDWKVISQRVDIPTENATMTVQGFVPKSCCSSKLICKAVPEDIFKKGCKDEMKAREHITMMFNSVFTIAPVSSLIFQLLGVALAIVMAILVKKDTGDDRGQFIPMSNQTNL